MVQPQMPRTAQAMQGAHHLRAKGEDLRRAFHNQPSLLGKLQAAPGAIEELLIKADLHAP